MDNGQGGRAAMPIFGKFMKYCYSDPKLPYYAVVQKRDASDPRYSFAPPEGYSASEYGCQADPTATTATSPGLEF